MKAIEKNGRVKISFKKEENICLYSSSSITRVPNTWTSNPYRKSHWYEYDTNFYSVCNDSLTFSCTNNGTTAINNSVSYDSNRNGFRGVENNTLKTGRIEKGSKSDQEFSYDYSNFASTPSYTYEWTILPSSTKAIVKEDIVYYCSGFGRIKRANERYCPSCGTKL